MSNVPLRRSRAEGGGLEGACYLGQVSKDENVIPVFLSYDSLPLHTDVVIFLIVGNPSLLWDTVNSKRSPI